MDLPEDIVKLRGLLRKKARKKGEKLWKEAKALKAQEEEKIIPICANCGIRGHTHEVHVKTASLYEIVGGRIGCKEAFLVYPNAQQKTAQAVLPNPRARHWHKQTFRGKNK